MLHGRWVLLLAVLSACSAGDGGGEVLGAAAEALPPGFWIGGVAIDPTTYPFEDPADLLMSAEGAGPRTLNVAVSTSVSPQISYTGTRTPSHSDISKALGYDVTKTLQLTADSSVLVPIDAYARVAAYPSFQKATWTIFGLGGVPVGGGVTYKPIGVYFDTCGCIGPDPCGAACVGGPLLGGEDPPPSDPDADAGAGDGG